MVMSKYKPLSDRLGAHTGDEFSPTFAELEEVLGFSLPKGARTGRAWWANDGKSQARAWADHGWEVGDIDHAAERVVFRRGSASGEALRIAADLQPLGAPAASEPELGEMVEPPRELLPVVVAQPAKPAINRKVGLATAIAGGVAVTAGLALFVARVMLTPKKQAPFPPRRRWPGR
jgi:hypothetical protein